MHRALWTTLGLGVAVWALPLRAGDDDDGHGHRPTTPVSSPAYQEECGSCHLAYPPGLLPARSWAAIMTSLEDHFGQNAEVEEATQQELTRYLLENAAETGSHRRSRKVLRGVPAERTPLRISTLPYIWRKHDELRPEVFARPAVTRRANCTACHSGAERGDFDDDRVKVPR